MWPNLLLANVVATKPATQVDGTASIKVTEAEDGPDYVSRGAHKLVGALDAFRLDLSGAEARDHDDLVEAIVRECVKLPLEQRLPGDVECALRRVGREGEKATALSGAEENGFHRAPSLGASVAQRRKILHRYAAAAVWPWRQASSTELLSWSHGWNDGRKKSKSGAVRRCRRAGLPNMKRPSLTHSLGDVA